MAEEHGIFWLGKQSKTGVEDKHLADTEEFVAGIRKACESCGCKVQQFVSAQGVYGTWLVEFSRDGTEERVLWNGKNKQLVLQVRKKQGLWEEPATMSVFNQDLNGFVAGVQSLLSGNA